MPSQPKYLPDNRARYCGTIWLWMYPDVEENHEQEGSREYKGSDDIIGIRDMLIVIMVLAMPKNSSGYYACS